MGIIKKNSPEQSKVKTYEFETLGEEIGELVARKQEAYGDSFGRSVQVMQVLYPNGISGEQMADALCVVRIIDKLFRIANKKDAFGESPYRDIAGYALLGLRKDETQEAELQDSLSEATPKGW